MEFKHYTKEGNSYILNNPFEKRRKIFAIAMACLIPVLPIRAIIIDPTVNLTSTIALVLLALIFGLLLYFSPSQKVSFHTEERLVKVRSKNKVKQYAFDQFLNFQKTRRKTNGITVDWIASMIFDENNKNQQIFLNTQADEKIVNEIIAETTALLNMKSVVA